MEDGYYKFGTKLNNLNNKLTNIIQSAMQMVRFFNALPYRVHKRKGDKNRSIQKITVIDCLEKCLTVPRETIMEHQLVLKHVT